MRGMKTILSAILIFVLICGGAVSGEETYGNGASLTGISIGIDPGHQKKANYGLEPIAPGSRTKKHKVSAGSAGVVTRIPEHETNLTIALALRDALKARGAKVYMTRTKADVNISNAKRALMMNKHGVDLVLHLHCDSSSNRKKRGITVFVRATGAKRKESGKAAEHLLYSMSRATGASARGIRYNNDYTGLNWSKVPAMLVEMGYLSNRKEDVLLNSPKYQAKLAEGMADGIQAYINETRMPSLLEGALTASLEALLAQAP